MISNSSHFFFVLLLSFLFISFVLFLALQRMKKDLTIKDKNEKGDGSIDQIKKKFTTSLFFCLSHFFLLFFCFVTFMHLHFNNIYWDFIMRCVFYNVGGLNLEKHFCYFNWRLSDDGFSKHTHIFHIYFFLVFCFS